MTMLTDNYILENLFFKGFKLKKFYKASDDSFITELGMPKKDTICPHCGNPTSRIKDYRVQKIKDLSILGKPFKIHLKKRRYICKHCNCSFTESNPLVHRYQHFTNRFYAQAYREFQSIQSFKSIAKRIGVSSTSVIRWFDKISHGLPKLPECFSIDEFKGNADNEKFQCNISAPLNHKIIDILPSRRIDKLLEHFRRYPISERLNVKKVVMDMSSLFKSATNILFPNAKIILDKFHVIRVVSWSMEAVRKRIQKQFHKERRKWFKRSKNILLKPRYKLSIEDGLVLDRILNSSLELEKAYVLKEKFYDIFKEKTEKPLKTGCGTGYI